MRVIILIMLMSLALSAQFKRWGEPDPITWEDLRFPASATKLGATSKPDFDYTNIGLLFPQNDAAEKTYYDPQFPHFWLAGSEIRPHIHYIQDEATLPTFKLRYRWYNNGEAVPAAWDTLTTSTAAFTYTSGAILQILGFGSISGTGMRVSSILDIVVWREDNDVTGDVLVKELDIHYQTNGKGSVLEYVK